MEIGIEYYQSKVPGNPYLNEWDFDTLDAMIEHYQEFKTAVRDYYMGDTELKEQHPILHKRLMKLALNGLEVRKIKERFYRGRIEKFSKSLDAEDYELN
jgi:hypothetical protein